MISADRMWRFARSSRIALGLHSANNRPPPLALQPIRWPHGCAVVIRHGSSGSGPSPSSVVGTVSGHDRKFSRRRARLNAAAEAKQSDKAAVGVSEIAAVKATAADHSTSPDNAFPELRQCSRAELLAHLAVQDPTRDPSFYRACVNELLSGRFLNAVNEAAFITCLQAMMREMRGPDAIRETRANHALLIDVLRPALVRGYFRQRPGQSTLRWLLQSLVASGEYARAVHIFDFLFVCMQRDQARALSNLMLPSPERTRWMETLRMRIELSGFTFKAVDERVTDSAYPLLHLDIACYVACMQAKMQLGLDLQVLALVQNTLPEVAAIEEFLFVRATPRSSPEDKATHVVNPNAETYLIAFHAACHSARASLARDLFMHALRCAEQDFASRALRIHRFMDKHDLTPISSDEEVDSNLAHLDPVTHERVVQMARKFKERQMLEQQQQPQQQHANVTAANKTTSSNMQSLTLPSFLLFDHSVFVLFIRSLLELALANFIGGSQSPEALKTREAIGVLRNYLANPVWIKLWLLDTPVTHKAQDGSEPTPAVTASQANPCTGLELLLHVFETARDYSGILSLFQSVLVPAIEAANQWFVRELIRSGTVEAVGHPDQHNPAATFAASQRLRLLPPPLYDQHAPHADQMRLSQLDALFTVVTIPPFLHPPVAALSASVYDSVANAYCHIAQQSGVGSGIGRSHLPSARSAPSASSASSSASDLSIHLFPFFRMLEARALMRTITINRGIVEHYCSDRSDVMQQRMRWYHETAIGLPELLSLLQRLPGNQWPVCTQLTDFVVRGAVVPCLIEEEFWSAHDAAAGSAAASPSLPIVRPYLSPSDRQLLSPSSRSLLQSIYLELMSKLFSVRKFPQVLQLYEHDQRRYFSPPLPLSVEQSLLVLQSYAWVGNSERALELLEHFSPSYSPAQRVLSTAFMVHFLETHVLKAIKKLTQKREPNVVIGRGATDSIAHQIAQPSEAQMLVDPFAALPAPSELPVPRVSSMGAPIVSSTGGPAYRAQSGFTVLPPWLGSTADVSAVGSDIAELQVDAEVEWKKVDAWKREVKARLKQRLMGKAEARDAQPAPSAYSPFASLVPEYLHPAPVLFDAPEYLLPHSATLVRRTFGPHAVTGPLFSEAPQGGTFSFGTGSPAFSSYATTTAQVAAPDSLHPSAKAAQADPMINWQLAQIQSCLTKLMRDPAALWFDPALRRCDLRAGVSYNLGRCIVYLLSLWIKSHAAGPSRRYQFLLPRSILRIKRADEITTQEQNTHAHAQAKREPRQDSAVSSSVVVPSPSSSSSSSPAADATSIVLLSDLEHVLLHSYSAEYLLSQYFPASSLSVRVVERSKLAQSDQTAEWQGLLDTAEALERQQKEDGEEAAEPPPPSLQEDHNKRDAFGMPLNQQPFVIFTVKWP